jgi:hypothetical protein
MSSVPSTASVAFTAIGEVSTSTVVEGRHVVPHVNECVNAVRTNNASTKSMTCTAM